MPPKPLAIEYLAAQDLRPYTNNARTHSAKQISQIAASIRQFGFNNPVLIDKGDVIIAGHGRIEAAKALGIETVPCLRLEHLSEAQKRAYIIADNRLAEKAGWDQETLAIELQYLTETELDLDRDFDISITGFEMPEIDVLIEGLAPEPEKVDPADNVPAVTGPAVTRLGDIWQIGPHRLICGDATQPDTYLKLLDGEQAQMIFADPPYNVKIDGNVCGKGRIKHREFAMGAGEMSEDEFTTFLTTVFTNLAANTCDGALCFICMDWRHIGEVLEAGKIPFSALKNLCVWAKTNGGMGSLYRSQHELVFVFKSGTASHIKNVELGRHGRYRTNVWSYAGVNSFSANRDDDLAMHPTVKPVALVMDAILDCSHRKGIVLDAFTGSGTTLVAAHKTGRRGYGIELDPHYCDVIIKRLAHLDGNCGLDAVLEATSGSFDEVAAERAPHPPIGEATQ